MASSFFQRRSLVDVAAHAVRCNGGSPVSRHVLQYDTARMPTICANVRGILVGRRPDQLFYDHAPKSVVNARRRAATTSMMNPHSCARTTGYPCGRNRQCDEYPYASVYQARGRHAHSWCVPREENNSQGLALRRLYRCRLCHIVGCYIEVSVC